MFDFCVCHFHQFQLYPNIVEVLVEVFDNHIQLVEGAVTSDRFEEERQFILKNVDYLFKTLLPLIEKKLTVRPGS